MFGLEHVLRISVIVECLLKPPLGGKLFYFHVKQHTCLLVLHCLYAKEIIKIVQFTTIQCCYLILNETSSMTDNRGGFNVHDF